jgi:hypothetical protein
MTLFATSMPAGKSGKSRMRLGGRAVQGLKIERFSAKVAQSV